MLVLALLLCGCATLRQELGHAEVHYEQARYEQALVWLDELEPDLGAMDGATRTRFLFIRGMTAYRLDRRDDALHYLAVARESANEQPNNPLRVEWRNQLDATLEELTPVGPTWRARRPPNER